MKAVVASLVTAAVLAGAAWASNVTPQQLSKLSARVTALQKTTAVLQAYVNKCAGKFVAVSDYGGDTAGSGYVFQNAGTDGTNAFNTSALDVTAKGDTADYWVVVADPTCVKAVP